jgi:DNA polymerase III sliding clamp (beta) subunit (PCNA family)
MITIPSSVLKDAIKRVGPAVDRRSIITAFRSVRLFIDGNTFEMTAGSPDGQMRFRAELEQGSKWKIDVCVDVARIVPLTTVCDDTVGISEQKNGRVKFSTSSYNVAVPSFPGEQFPLVSVSEKAIAAFDVVGLPGLISSVAFAADANDVRPTCQGVWLQSDGDLFTAVSTDGKILAASQVKLGATPFAVMISTDAAELLASLDPTHLTLTTEHLIARNEVAELIIKPMLNQSFDWARLIPAPKRSAKFESAPLREAVSMYRHYGDKIGTVKFKTEGTECTVEISNADDDARAELDVELGDDDTVFDIAFSGSQLAQILQRAPADEITFFWEQASAKERPRAFLVQNGNWRGVITPLIV